MAAGTGRPWCVACMSTTENMHLPNCPVEMGVQTPMQGSAVMGTVPKCEACGAAVVDWVQHEVWHKMLSGALAELQRRLTPKRKKPDPRDEFPTPRPIKDTPQANDKDDTPTRPVRAPDSVLRPDTVAQASPHTHAIDPNASVSVGPLPVMRSGDTISIPSVPITATFDTDGPEPQKRPPKKQPTKRVAGIIPPIARSRVLRNEQSDADPITLTPDQLQQAEEAGVNITVPEPVPYGVSYVSKRASGVAEDGPLALKRFRTHLADFNRQYTADRVQMSKDTAFLMSTDDQRVWEKVGWPSKFNAQQWYLYGVRVEFDETLTLGTVIIHSK